MLVGKPRRSPALSVSLVTHGACVCGVPQVWRTQPSPSTAPGTQPVLPEHSLQALDGAYHSTLVLTISENSTLGTLRPM